MKTEQIFRIPEGLLFQNAWFNDSHDEPRSHGKIEAV